jgi:hypothetical protein
MSVVAGAFRLDGSVSGWDAAAVGDGGAANVDQWRERVAAHRRGGGGPIVFG